MKTYAIRYGQCGRYARAITENGVDIIHLYEGSVVTEENIERIVGMLNLLDGLFDRAIWDEIK
jgi:hypothetical protein